MAQQITTQQIQILLMQQILFAALKYLKKYISKFIMPNLIKYS